MTSVIGGVSMILGEPTLQSILELIDEEGCPRCGKIALEISVNGPNEIILHHCGHTINAEPYIESG